MFVTVFPMVCHILAFLVNFYIKNLSQNVLVLVLWSWASSPSASGTVSSVCAWLGQVLLPCAYWTVQWWVVAMMVFFQFRTGIKVLPLATFFVIALMRAASLPRFWGMPGLYCYTLTPRATIYLFSLHRTVAAAPLTSVLENNLSWAADHSIFLCFCKSHCK